MCSCKEDIKPQEYKNQVVLTLPKHMRKYWNKDTVCVDTCLVDEVVALWDIGIITTGSCCGHNVRLPFIGVIDDDVIRMVDLGYKTQTNISGIDNFNRKDSFYPESIDINIVMLENSIKHLIKILLK